jgi:hypothetical protein
MWFKDLMGFDELNPDQVRENILIDGNYMISKVNGKKYIFGGLETISLEELRKTVDLNQDSKHELKVSEVISDVKKLHQLPENAGALFQVASQFNLLEMIGPSITPEKGVGIYDNDHTQGPACAISCGAGTIYRNYFAEVNSQIGQDASNQINTLEDLNILLNNTYSALWDMKNGYALIHNNESALKIKDHLSKLTNEEYDLIKSKIKIGIQWNTEVTLGKSGHLVSQVFCSALPVSYSGLSQNMSEEFARLILDSAYESTFLAAIKNFSITGNNRLFLTLLGGNAFGNKISWITEAIYDNLLRFKRFPLDIYIVSHSKTNVEVSEIIRNYYEDL